MRTDPRAAEGSIRGLKVLLELTPGEETVPQELTVPEELGS